MRGSDSVQFKSQLLMDLYDVENQSDSRGHEESESDIMGVRLSSVPLSNRSSFSAANQKQESPPKKAKETY